MKKLLAFFPLLLLLTACPYETSVPPGDPGTENVNPELIGTWYTEPSNEVDFLEVNITKKKTNEFLAEILEATDSYPYGTKSLRVFETQLDQFHVLYIQPITSDKHEKFILYHYNLLNNHKIELIEIGLEDGALDNVYSSEVVRRKLLEVLKTGDHEGQKFIYKKR